jgi:hypothetical protein
MSLLEPGVLCRNVEIAQPPLQWGALVHCAASSQGKTRISDANECRGSPYRGLGGLGQPGRALQRPRDRVVPVVCALSPQESAVSPGAIKTPMHSSEAHGFLSGLQPMGRMGEMQEVTDAVMYLEKAAFVTGEILHVDGGWSAGRG